MVNRFWRSVFITCVTLVLVLVRDEEISVVVPAGFTDARFGVRAVVAETVYIDRKLKEKHDDTARSMKPNEVAKERIEEDYPEFDPVPSTKPSIKSGPIVHDTSGMPSIPRSKPPNHP